MLAMAGVPATAAAADSETIEVTSAANAGPGSFREAIAMAEELSADARVVLPDELDVQLNSPVVYEGTGRLRIIGNGSTIRPAAGWTADATPDSGLFVSRSEANLRFKQITFKDSPNNGVAVFLPNEASGDYTLIMKEVAITGSEFHGLLVDGQHTPGYDTAGVFHRGCEDVHPVNSPATINLALRDSFFDGNGRVEGAFDSTIETGCPIDFDGIRADEGGHGSLWTYMARVSASDNGGDGVELDERGRGIVRSMSKDSTFDRNGFGNPDDPDDGYDIDEDTSGQVWARFLGGSASDNADEGVDIDESDNGHLELIVTFFDANRNNEEGIKADEASKGRLAVHITGTSVSASLSNDGMELTEEDGGHLWATLANVAASGNSNDGIKFAESEGGTVQATFTSVTASANGDDGLVISEDLDSGAATGDLLVTIEDSWLTDNGDVGFFAEQVAPGIGAAELIGGGVTGNGTDFDLSGVILF